MSEDDILVSAGVPLDSVHHARPPLPEPQRDRWQPLRLGLVEMFHYDSEEFWFHDGHLLLRGNNGTGKSKVLSLTLPFLFDGSLRPGRIEPDGDNGKKMAWNLLLNSYQRRIGYTWIEFGRRDADGTIQYLTLGAGLSAVASRTQVESWFFILVGGAQDGARIGRDLWLTSSQGVVLTRDRLREAIEGRGQLFETVASYRRAVDERLFSLGARRYDALMDTLIQLRQPQLSRKPDEAGLSHALTEALPPLSQELLTDVAEALGQLEEDRRQLEDTRALASAVERFDKRYRDYSSMLSRRQARELRQAQTDFDNASHQRNQAQVKLQLTQSTEAAAILALETAETELAAERIRLETLQSNPIMQDANRLETAEKDVTKRVRSVEYNQGTHAQAEASLGRESRLTTQSARFAEDAERALVAVREECLAAADAAGVSAEYARSPLIAVPSVALADLPMRDFAVGQRTLKEAIGNRREELEAVKRRLAEVHTAQLALGQLQDVQRERQADLEEALVQRSEADSDFLSAGEALVGSWSNHADSLVHLRFDAEEAIQDLIRWTPSPSGENPARQALLQAQQRWQFDYSARQFDLHNRHETLEQEQSKLAEERSELQAGRSAVPALPHTRGADTRRSLSGAPFWQLIDFRENVDEAGRAGLEAAMEAMGLLDAWVTEDGTLLSISKDEPWLDEQWTLRPVFQGATLAKWLRPDAHANSSVPASMVERLLASVSCSDEEGASSSAEAWVSLDGHFRLGTLAGAWTKPQAVYIGQSARAAARQQRIASIDIRLWESSQELRVLQRESEDLEYERNQADNELSGAPSDQPLFESLHAASSAAKLCLMARSQLDRAEAQCRSAEQELQNARDALNRDAVDLRLPTDIEKLSTVAGAIQRCLDDQYRLVQAAQEWRRAFPELSSQRVRETEARVRFDKSLEQLAASRLEAEESKAHYQALRDTVGAEVDSLRRQLADARRAVEAGNVAERKAFDDRRISGEARAQASAEAVSADQLLTQRTDARLTAVARLQRFAATSLLSSALPMLEVPDLKSMWTIDPALTLARRVEQALTDISDDEIAWNRMQRQINEDLQELQRTLGALGHQAPADTTDWGFVVHIIFHNKPERPDQLLARLTDDIAQRSELLTANERAVLENHLQAEIATEVQRLLRSAQQQVDAINTELHKRPTSTGVRYRLRWQPLSIEEGAPVGLDAARERLLNTSADLWSAEDRRVVGAMLQMRIEAERERADAEVTHIEGDSGGSLIDQLARALDYRRWHRFRVERLQDGQWRKLSGPASSGERALGLTVPLFAAIASFYSQGSNPHAPRLMLLDEAFAGIDDAARAHCMALIREFDLDFVITSEREWACYAELPGVSICQLQRREGIDAVFVSRWTWDGKSKRREADPDRRFSGS